MDKLEEFYCESCDTICVKNVKIEGGVHVHAECGNKVRPLTAEESKIGRSHRTGSCD